MRTLRTKLCNTRRERLRNLKNKTRLGNYTILRKIDTGQLRWLGHLERMGEVRIAKRRGHWTTRGNRCRSRPGKRWKDVVRETLERYDLPNLEELQSHRMTARQIRMESSERIPSLIQEPK